MSVDVLGLIEEAGIDAEEFVTTPIYTGSIQFKVETARSTGLRVGYDPIKDNPFHAEVWGPEGRANRFSKSQRDALLSGASWFVELDEVQISP